MKILSTVTIASAAAFALAVPAFGQEHEHGMGDPEKLGQVHFENSCSPAASQPFDRAVALLHSFWFSGAIDGFKGVLAADPGCGIAEWGIALSHWGNPFGGSRSPKQLQDGLAAAEKAAAIGAQTERERDYISAVRGLYQDYQTADSRTRTLAYEKAMERLYEKYPSDKEAAAFYALALDGTALPTDKTYTNQLKAAAILEKLFVRRAGSSRARALLDPHLRHAGAGRSGGNGRPTLRDDRTVGATRAAHAVAHVHPRRLLAGVHRDQHQVCGGSRQGGCSDRSASRPRLRDVRLSSNGAGSRAPHRSWPTFRRLAPGWNPPERRQRRRSSAGGVCHGGDSGPLRPRTRGVGRCGGTRTAPNEIAAERCHDAISPGQSGPPAADSRRLPRRTSKGSRRCAMR